MAVISGRPKQMQMVQKISVLLKNFEEHPAYLAGSSFYVHQLEQPCCKQSLNCSIKPPRIELTGVTTLLAEWADGGHY